MILTGDDFGLALPVNEAIVEAHCKGALTTASLMPGAKFAQDAVERARQCPSLKVGLHLVLVEGRPILSPWEIPDLLDSRGAFLDHLALAGFRFFFLPGVRRQLEAEIRAQFEAFQKTELALDHVNAHNHMHVHPTVLRLVLKIGRSYGLKAIRFPYEPPVRSWKATGRSLGLKCSSWIFLHPWLSLMKYMLRQARVKHNDFLFGMADSGAMTLDPTLGFLRHLPNGVTEMCFHPATRRCMEIDRTMPHYRHEDEFISLIDDTLLRTVQAKGIQRIAFSDL